MDAGGRRPGTAGDLNTRLRRAAGACFEKREPALLLSRVYAAVAAGTASLADLVASPPGMCARCVWASGVRYTGARLGVTWPRGALGRRPEVSGGMCGCAEDGVGRPLRFQAGLLVIAGDASRRLQRNGGY